MVGFAVWNAAGSLSVREFPTRRFFGALFFGAFDICREAACAAARTSGGSAAVSGFALARGSRAMTRRLCASTAQSMAAARRWQPRARVWPLRKLFLRMPTRASVCARRRWQAAKSRSSRWRRASSAGSRGRRVEDALLLEQAAVGAAGKAAVGADTQHPADA